MKVGFYYHLPMTSTPDGGYKISGLLGVFLENLAQNCNELCLFLHEAKPNEQVECDYRLSAQNIKWINLGPKPPAWSRDLFHWMQLKKISRLFDQMDAMIVRAPTPYGPYINRYVDPSKLVYLIVGDYSDSARFMRVKSFRDVLIKKYVQRNDRLFSKALKNAKIMVNSHELLQKYSALTKEIALIRTTTLSENDFYKRTDSCQNEEIKLLYTGRIDPAKGLDDLVRAIALINSPKKITLHIVGWDTDVKQQNYIALQQLIDELALTSKVFFHGKKSVGAALNAYYRDCDIYVFPSHFEGFPRTLWEAMANSLPIVCTPVGGIPYVLQDRETALFAPPHTPKALAKAIVEMIENEVTRKQFIERAFELASSNTLAQQTKIMVEKIKSFTTQ